MLSRNAAVLTLTIGFCALAMLAPATNTLAQSSSEALPEGWRDLKPESFIKSFRRTQRSNSPLAEAPLRAAKRQAAALLESTADAESFWVLNNLREIAGDQLTDEQNALLSKRLRGSPEAGGLPSFAELRSWAALMHVTAPPSDCKEYLDRCKAIGEWVEKHPDANAVKNAHKWLITAMDLSWYVRQRGTTGFSVVWEGSIVAPRTGAYRFSPCGHDISTEFIDDGIRCKFEQEMSVSIDGNAALSATPSQWSGDGPSVRLVGGKPSRIRVVYTHKKTHGPLGQVKLPAAVLHWSGPGLAKSIVPRSAFRTPDGEKNGLAAKYRIALAGEDIHVACVEPNVEHVWRGGDNLFCVSPAAQKMLIDALWSRVMSPEYWERLESKKEPNQHRLLEEPRLANYLSCDQRAAFLRELTDRPALLSRLTWRQAAYAFSCYQYGAEDEAIDFFGSYLQQTQLNAEPTLGPDYFGNNRMRYRLLTIPIVWQHPEYFEQLRDGYLETEEGECCLGAAHILAYGHLVKNRIVQWAELLDARLEDESLTGDRRVNWLIARAVAQELRWVRPHRHFLSREAWEDGLPWLEQALEQAGGAETELQVLREFAVRELAMNAEAGFERTMARARANPLYGRDGADWQDVWDKQAERQKAAQKAEAERANAAYLAALKRRRERAEQAGNAEDARRYRRRESAAGSGR